MTALHVGQVVRYAKPDPNEEGEFRFILRELNGDHALIELICDYPIKPVELVLTSDIVCG